MSVIDIYLNTAPTQFKDELNRIREIVKTELPEVEETLSYGMPAFKYKGKYLLGIAANQKHMSLHPTPEPIEALKEQLKDFSTSKGTIRFNNEKPLPKKLIVKIIKNRVANIN